MRKQRDAGEAELAEVETPAELAAPANPLALLARAVERGLAPEQLEKLVALQERYEATQAAARWAEAVTAFRSECPTVFKGRQVKNKDGTARFSFAEYADIKRVTRPIEAKYGIVTTFSFDHSQPGRLLVTCRVRVGTHHEDYLSSIALPNVPGANVAQDSGAAMAYAKRYAYVAAHDIVITGEDDDGASLRVLIDPGEAEQIRELLGSVRLDERKFWSWVSHMKPEAGTISRVEDIPQTHAARVIDMLRRKKARGQ
jgi:ERF superfamily